MRTNTEGLLNKFPTVATCLCGEARVHSDDLMSSTLSLHFKNVEKRAPTGVHDAFCEMMVLGHVIDLKVFHGNMVIALCVLPGDLILEVPALSLDLEIGLRRALSSFASAMTAFLTTSNRPLLASQGFLRGTIKTRVLHGISRAIGQERFQTHVNADIRMFTSGWFVFDAWLHLAYDQGIPMSIGSQDQMHRFESTL